MVLRPLPPLTLVTAVILVLFASINELTFNRVNDGKIYDLLGRELTKVPVGKMYIKNKKNTSSNNEI